MKDDRERLGRSSCSPNRRATLVTSINTSCVCTCGKSNVPYSIVRKKILAYNLAIVRDFSDLE